MITHQRDIPDNFKICPRMNFTYLVTFENVPWGNYLQTRQKTHLDLSGLHEASTLFRWCLTHWPLWQLISHGLECCVFDSMMILIVNGTYLVTQMVIASLRMHYTKSCCHQTPPHWWYPSNPLLVHAKWKLEWHHCCSVHCLPWRLDC